MSETSVTICIPTYKRTEYLRHALDSCLAQTYPHYQIIVHDDTQDDSIRRIAESYSSSKIRYYQNKPALGLIPKLNLFLDLATTEWIVMLADDDVFEPTYLEALVPYISQQPRATLIKGRFGIINKDGGLIRMDGQTPPALEAFKSIGMMLHKDQEFKISISGFLFPRKTLKELGGFADFHQGWHTDRLAWIQLASKGLLLSDPRQLCNIRLHDSTLTMEADTNFDKAIQTQFAFYDTVKQTLLNLNKQAKHRQDHRDVKNALRALDRYFGTCDPKENFDHAFIFYLEKERHEMNQGFARVRDAMKKLHVPVSRRACFYLILSFFPRGIRTKLLKKFLDFRARKLDWYIKKHGKSF